MKDVVIVGAGLAGLSAGWRLRNRDILLLESGARIGGRVYSERRGKYWMNWGGHVYAGAGTSTDQLLHEVGVTAVDVPGSLGSISMNGKFIRDSFFASYPFRLPMSMAARASTTALGIKIMSALIFKYLPVVRTRPGESGAQRQQRIYDFEDNRSFRDFIGSGHPEDAEALFATTVIRPTAAMEELQAGQGIGYFNLVLGIGQGLNRGIVGGPSTFTGALAAALDDRIELEAVVYEVVQKKKSVVVRYRQGGVDKEVEARTAILATTASVANKIGVNLPDDLRSALGQIKYGPHVVTAYLTNETGRQPWDDVYAIAAPKRSFAIATNQASIVRGTEKERQPGGSFMVFSPGPLGTALLDKSEEEIAQIHLKDLDEVVGGNLAEHVVEAKTIKLVEGSPFCFPGRSKLQPTLMRGADRIFLAGDYLGTLYTETSITSGFQAAQEAASLIQTEIDTNSGAISLPGDTQPKA